MYGSAPIRSGPPTGTVAVRRRPKRVAGLSCFAIDELSALPRVRRTHSRLGAICRPRCAIASAHRSTPAVREQSGRSARGPGVAAERSSRAARTVRSVAHLSAAGQAATDRGTRLHGHAASEHGRSLGRGEHRGDQRIGPWIAVVVDVDRQRSTLEVPHDLRRLRGTACAIVANTGAPLPLTAPLLARADTQHATTTAVGATGPATIRSSRPQRPATTRSRQETSVQPRNHGPGLRITRAYRSNSARVAAG